MTTFLIVVATLALIALVVLIVSAPLRRMDAKASTAQFAEMHDSAANGAASAVQTERDQLEAAREAKYREIRDCELDYRTGKLSRADYEAIDGQLRSEALAILDRLESISPPDAAGS